jgi:hypothetical protein
VYRHIYKVYRLAWKSPLYGVNVCIYIWFWPTLHITCASDWMPNAPQLIFAVYAVVPFDFLCGASLSFLCKNTVQLVVVLCRPNATLRSCGLCCGAVPLKCPYGKLFVRSVLTLGSYSLLCLLSPHAAVLCRPNAAFDLCCGAFKIPS